jgi:Nickel responsive protein SCO4226-like
MRAVPAELSGFIDVPSFWDGDRLPDGASPEGRPMACQPELARRASEGWNHTMCRRLLADAVELGRGSVRGPRSLSTAWETWYENTSQHAQQQTRGVPMPKFVIERTIPPGTVVSAEDLRAASLRSLEVLREMGPEIQWIQSFVTDDKIYCIYYARDESMILEHARRGGFAADRVAAVRQLLDPVNFQ